MQLLGVGVAAESGPIPLATGLAIGTQAALLFGACALLGAGVLLYRHRRRLTRYHLPAVLLLVLAVTGAFGTAVGFEQAAREGHRVEYTVEQCVTGEDDPAGVGDSPVTTVPADRSETDFEDLSPEAQEVFLQTLDNGGTYTAQKRPSDLRYEGDTRAVNYVRYESTCYALVGDTVSGIPFYIPRYLGAGLLVAVLFLCGWWSLTTPSFRVPVAVLAGSSTGVGAALVLAGWLPTVMHTALLFLAASCVGYALGEGAIRLLEARRG
jgi:LPXTG-motif cell wall-anchored protein